MKNVRTTYRIGRNTDSGTAFQGYVSDLRVYSKALTEYEVNMARGKWTIEQ